MKASECTNRPRFSKKPLILIGKRNSFLKVKDVVDKPKMKRMIRLATIAIIPKEDTPTRRLVMNKKERVITKGL